MERKFFGKYLLSLLLFGSNGIIAYHIHLHSTQIVLLRTLIGCAFLFLLSLFTGSHFSLKGKQKALGFLLLSGVATGASWMFLYEAYARIGVSIASLLYYCGPVIVMALSPLLFREALTRRKLIGFGVVLLGICLLNGTASGSGKSHFGILCGLLSAITYALMVICNKKAAEITGLENASLQLFFAFLTVLLFVGTRPSLLSPIPSGDLLPVFLLGICNTGIGCYLYFSSLGKLPAQTVAICGYLEPLSAVVLSVLLLQELLHPLQIAGTFLIFGGAVFGDRIKKERLSYS